MVCKVFFRSQGFFAGVCLVFFYTQQRSIFANCFFTLGQSVKKTLGKKKIKLNFEALNKFKSKSFSTTKLYKFLKSPCWMNK